MCVSLFQENLVIKKENWKNECSFEPVYTCIIWFRDKSYHSCTRYYKKLIWVCLHVRTWKVKPSVKRISWLIFLNKCIYLFSKVQVLLAKTCWIHGGLVHVEDWWISILLLISLCMFACALLLPSLVVYFSWSFKCDSEAFYQPLGSFAPLVEVISKPINAMHRYRLRILSFTSVYFVFYDAWMIQGQVSNTTWTRYENTYMYARI